MGGTGIKHNPVPEIRRVLRVMAARTYIVMLRDDEVAVHDSVSLSNAVSLPEREEDGVYTLLSYDHQGRLDTFASGAGDTPTFVYVERMTGDEFEFYRFQKQVGGQEGYYISRSAFDAGNPYYREAYNTDAELAAHFLQELKQVLQDDSISRFSEFVTAEDIQRDETMPSLYEELFTH